MNIDTTKTLAENCVLIGLSDYKVKKFCDSNNIILPDGRGKKPNVTVNPFHLTTEESNYWLGYFLGDGCLSPKVMGICSKDSEVTEAFHKYTGNTNKIHSRAYYVQGEERLMYLSYFGNVEIYEYLINLGFPRKGKAFNTDLKIPLTPSIVRGLFDADGSLSKNTFKITSSNINLINTLDDYFKSHGFNFKIYTKKNAYDLIIRWTYGIHKTAAESKRALYDLLYVNETCQCLERKRLHFAALLGD